MITITYDRANNSVCIRGHAGAGPKGEDVVCAGVSALAQTLAANVRHWGATGRLVEEPKTFLQEGFGEIQCNPKPKYEKSVRQVMVAICAGFEIVANAAPEYVSFALGGDEEPGEGAQ